MELAVVLFLGGAFILVWLYLWSRQQQGAGVRLDVDQMLRALPQHAATDAVLVSRQHGSLSYANPQARRWLALDNTDPDLEAIARRAEPPDSFLDLFARETRSSFHLADRWVEATSHFFPSPQETQIVVLMRELGGAGAGPDALDLSRSMTIVNEISETINASLGIEQVLGAILTIVRKAIPASAGEITLWDEARRMLDPRGWVGDAAYVLALDEAGGVYGSGEGISGWIARYRKPVLVGDPDEETAVRPKLKDNLFRSFIGVPLLMGDRFLGTLELASTESHYFTRADLALLQAVSKQVAVTIFNTELYAEQTRRIDDLSSLGDVIRLREGGGAVEPVYRALNERIARLLDAEVCGVLLYDERKAELDAEPPFFGLPLHIVRSWSLPLPEGSRQREIWERGDVWISSDLVDEPLAEALNLTLLVNAAGLTSVALTPLLVGSRRMGALLVGNKRTHGGFTLSDTQLLQLLASQAAVVVGDIYLSQQEQRRDAELTALQQIAQAFGSFAHDGEFDARINEHIARLTDAAICGILLPDAERDALVPHGAFFGLEPALTERYALPLRPGSALEHIWQHEDYWLTNNAVADKLLIGAGLSEFAAAAGLRQTLLAVMTAGDKRIGVIQVANKGGGEDFTEKDARLLLIFAAQVGALIESARLLGEAQRRANQAEQMRDSESESDILRRRVQELDAISRVSSELVQTLDLDHVLSVIREEAVRATEASGDTIVLLQPHEQWKQPDQPQLDRRLGQRHLPNQLADIERAAVERGEAILIDDYQTETMKPLPVGMRSALAAPIIYETRPVGVIHLYHEAPGQFDRRAADFLATLAVKAALSYGNNLRFLDSQERSERLRRRLEQLNTIFELGQMLQSNVDPVTMMEAIAYSVQRSCGFDVVVMSMADHERGTLRRVAQAGLPIEVFENTKMAEMSLERLNELFAKEDYQISESYFLPFEQASKWYVDGLEALSTSFTGNRTMHPRALTDWRDGDMLLVPVTGARGQLLGLMNLDRPFDGRRPERPAVEVLEIFAHQAASTLENNRLYIESLRSAEQEARLNEMMEAISSTLNMREIVEAMARGALRLLPFMRMTVALLDSERHGFDLLRVSVKSDDSLVVNRERADSLDHTGLGRSYDHGQDFLYHAGDAEVEALTDLRALHAGGERTSLIVPLISGGICLGAMHIGSDLVNAFGFEEFRPLMKRIANLAAVAIQNARLFEETRSRTQRLSLLNRVSVALAQSLDTENILEIALREIAESLDVNEARAYIFDREQHTARLVVEYPRGDFPPEHEFPLNASPTIDRVVHDVRPLVVGDVTRLPEGDAVRAEIEPRGVSAYLLMPMLIGGQTTGAFEFDVRDGAYDFDAEKIELALIIANQAAVAVLNSNLLEQTLVRTRELETLLEAAQATSFTLDLDEVLQSVVRLTMQALDMDDCALMLYDNIEEMLRVEIDVNRAGDESREMAPGTTFDLLQSPAKQAAIHERQVIVVRVNDENADPHEREEMRQSGDLARMLVPLIVRDSAIGLLQVDLQTQMRTFTHRDVRMARALGAQAASAVENARLSTETAAQVEQSLVINDLSRAISSTMDIGLMIRIVRSQVPGLTAAGEIYLALHNPETDEITFPMAVRDGQDIEIPPRLLGSDEVSFVIRHRRPLSLGGDNPSADEVRRNLKISNGEGDVTRYLGVPLIAGDQVVGVLAVRDARTTRPFGLNDQRILTTIGTQLGAAIQNANLYDRVRNFAEDLNIRVQERTVELQQERDRIDALYRITSELGRTLDMDRVLDRALDTVSRVLDAQGGAVMLIDPMSDQLYTRAVLMPPADDNGHSGEQGVVLRKRDTGKLGSSAQRLALPVEPLAQWLIEHERALLVNNLRELPFWNASLDGADEWHSALAVVLETNEDVQGVMVFLGREPGAFTEPQLKLVSAAANQVSAAINNADLYNLIRDQAERMTTLLRAEQEEAEKSSAILEGIADGVLLADSNATIILFNGAAERILGIPRDYALGQPLSRLAALDNRSGSWVNTLSEWALNPQQSTSQELLIDRLDLGKRVVSVHASPVSSGDQFLGTVSVFRDVTKDVEVDRMKSEFISNVSHELRTPMTSIKGYADLLLMGAAGQVSDVQRQFLGTIKNNADRLASLVNDLLNISRIDSGREKLKLEPVPVAEVIEQVVRNLTARESYARKPLELAVAVDPSLPHIQADRNRIMQVLTNLVDNAFNYTGAGGKIGIEAQQQAERGRVLIKVSDTGIGIPEDFQARVWNRFERNEESALVMDVAGTGLGLPIVKDLVEMHHGEVWLESEVGKGSTFFVALPIDGPDQSAPAYTRQVSETAANTSGSVEG